MRTPKNLDLCGLQNIALKLKWSQMLKLLSNCYLALLHASALISISFGLQRKRINFLSALFDKTLWPQLLSSFLYPKLRTFFWVSFKAGIATLSIKYFFRLSYLTHFYSLQLKEAGHFCFWQLKNKVGFKLDLFLKV